MYYEYGKVVVSDQTFGLLAHIANTHIGLYVIQNARNRREHACSPTYYCCFRLHEILKTKQSNNYLWTNNINCSVDQTNLGITLQLG